MAFLTWKMPKLAQILQSSGLRLLQDVMLPMMKGITDVRSEQGVKLEMSVFDCRVEYRRLNLEGATIENYKKKDKLDGRYEENA